MLLDCRLALRFVKGYKAHMTKELTEKQQSFLKNLVSFNGDAKEAAKKAGYSNHYQVTKSLKTEIIDLAETIHTSVQDGKIPREERSMCMKKFWALVKAVEDSSKP